MKIEGNLSTSIPNVSAETVHKEVPKQEHKELKEKTISEMPEESNILSEEKRKAVEEFLQKSLSEKNPDLEIRYTQRKYSVHEGTDRIMVTVIDTETDKVLLEIPEEKFLDIVSGIWEAAGLVIDERR